MRSNFLFIPFLLSLITLVSCSPRGKFVLSADYQNAEPLGRVFVPVIGSKETNRCFDYLEDYLKDSLTGHGLSIESKFYCCRDKHTDIGQLVSEMMPTNLHADHILTVAVTKDVVGYGTTSSRELVIVLFDTKDMKMTWQGKMKIDFDWFVSDENYRTVAKKINDLIISELIKKAIIRA
jgi:hypothetical protein